MAKQHHGQESMSKTQYHRPQVNVTLTANTIKVKSQCQKQNITGQRSVSHSQQNNIKFKSQCQNHRSKVIIVTFTAKQHPGQVPMSKTKYHRSSANVTITAQNNIKVKSQSERDNVKGKGQGHI